MEDYLDKILVSEYLNGESTVKLAKKYNISPSLVRGRLVRHNIKLRSNKENSRKYFVDSNIFEEINNEEKAYWFGFLYADGYISSSNGKRLGLSIGAVDKDHIIKYNNFLKSTYPIGEYEVTNGYKIGTKYCRVIVSDEKIYDDLLSKGMNEHKSYNMCYPEWLRNDLHRHFIRGFFDGDGAIKKNGNSFAIDFMCLPAFKDGLVNILNQQVSISKFSYRARKDSCETKALDFFGKSAYHILKYMYDDNIVSLKRKEKRANEAIEYFSRLYQE